MWIYVGMILTGAFIKFGFDVAWVPWLLMGLGGWGLVYKFRQPKPHHIRGEKSSFIEERHDF
ncbi:hypothetical protein [Phaeacidiphilus oryzae]|uniref:hypothetical protein n=1 Tax=Phaeacidiphilus oryzae TaxID=348818 RepID=UPI00056B5AB6|nr:hypothetical protein [Phaeacidiphilus oryzae]